MELYTELLNGNFNIVNNDNLLVNMYITLLFLNNDYYSLENMKKEIDTTKIILIKINNLKVKIQLKRKEKEINSLIQEIKDSVNESYNLIAKYIKDKDELFTVIDSLDPVKITSYIDSVTKKEMNVLDDIDEVNSKRCELINLIKNNDYSVKDNKFSICNEEIDLRSFYDTFSYLLDINNYGFVYKSDENNNARKEIIEKIISFINKKDDEYDKIVIPIGLTYLLSSLGKMEINTSDFEIENIKISDLYSLANEKCLDKNTSKWKNINIPNDFLFDKIKKIITSGMYYFRDNRFVFELVEDKVSDFKISIDIDKIKTILKNTVHV